MLHYSALEFDLDSGVPGRRVQPVIEPTHFTDGIVVTHQRVLPPAVWDGVEITEGRKNISVNL